MSCQICAVEDRAAGGRELGDEGIQPEPLPPRYVRKTVAFPAGFSFTTKASFDPDSLVCSALRMGKVADYRT
jgi:hypothetical protein